MQCCNIFLNVAPTLQLKNLVTRTWILPIEPFLSLCIKANSFFFSIHFLKMKASPSTLVHFLFPKINFFFQQIWEWKQNEKNFAPLKNLIVPNFILCPLTVLGSTRRINYTFKCFLKIISNEWNLTELHLFVLFVELKAIRVFIYLRNIFGLYFLVLLCM